ncbi:unnamed protein product [Trichobilharzia regenti]|nr:unnamed protein product [Trichobilharzia regenti]
MITESAPFKPTATSGVDGSRTTNPIQNNPTASSGAVPSSSSNANGALLSNLWTQLDHIQPTIPDRLSVAILEGAGVQMENSDPRLARLVSLAGQKFLTDILSDAMLHWRLANGQPTGLLNHPGSSASSVAGQVSTTSSAASQNQPVPQSPSSSKCTFRSDGKDL